MGKCARCGRGRAFIEYGGALLHEGCYEETIRPSVNQYFVTKKLSHEERERMYLEIVELENKAKGLRRQLDDDLLIPSDVKEIHTFLDGRTETILND